jgi:hypothetical protein
MSIVFVEYSILEDARRHYLDFMEAQRKKHPNLEWFEGTDQPNLFVELWREMSYEDYERMKRIRLDSTDGEWGSLGAWIKGGRTKLHLWHFSRK